MCNYPINLTIQYVLPFYPIRNLIYQFPLELIPYQTHTYFIMWVDVGNIVVSGIFSNHLLYGQCSPSFPDMLILNEITHCIIPCQIYVAYLLLITQYDAPFLVWITLNEFHMGIPCWHDKRYGLLWCSFF